jgi:hypothetical protein
MSPAGSASPGSRTVAIRGQSATSSSLLRFATLVTTTRAWLMRSRCSIAFGPNAVKSG